MSIVHVPPQTRSGVDFCLRELKNRLGDLDGGRAGFGVVAGLFFELYRSPELKALAGELKEVAWKSLLKAEGLRVEDLDPRLDDAAVRVFACALDERLPRRAVANVLGVSHTTVKNYVAAAGGRPSTGTLAGIVPLRSALDARPNSHREHAKSVVAELISEVSAVDPAVPGDLLILATTALAEASTFVEDFVDGMGSGSSLGVKDEARVRRLSRDAQALIGKLAVAGPGSGGHG